MTVQHEIEGCVSDREKVGRSTTSTPRLKPPGGNGEVRMMWLYGHASLWRPE